MNFTIDEPAVSQTIDYNANENTEVQSKQYADPHSKGKMTINAGGGEEVSTISIESEHIVSNGTETISSSQLEVALKGPK